MAGALLLGACSSAGDAAGSKTGDDEQTPGGLAISSSAGGGAGEGPLGSAGSGGQGTAASGGAPAEDDTSAGGNPTSGPVSSAQPGGGGGGSAAQGAEGGAGGDSAGRAAGGGAGGLSEQDPGPCPESSPAGSPCDDAGRICTYGDSPRPECRTEVTCSDGQWVETPRDCMLPSPPSECPEQAPGVASACDEVGQLCSYESGVECFCVAAPIGWLCDIPSSGHACAPLAANAGTDCSASEVAQCNYPCGQLSAYNVSTLCGDDGRWTWLVSACSANGQSEESACADDSDCGSEEACIPASACGDTGICTPTPPNCDDFEDAAVCGCDDITYVNECEAARAGVGIAENSSCNGECVYLGGVFENGDDVEPTLQCERCTCIDGAVMCEIVNDSCT